MHVMALMRSDKGGNLYGGLPGMTYKSKNISGTVRL